MWNSITAELVYAQGSAAPAGPLYVRTAATFNSFSLLMRWGPRKQQPYGSVLKLDISRLVACWPNQNLYKFSSTAAGRLPKSLVLKHFRVIHKKTEGQQVCCLARKMQNSPPSYSSKEQDSFCSGFSLHPIHLVTTRHWAGGTEVKLFSEVTIILVSNSWKKAPKK